MSKYQRRHYLAIADTLKDASTDDLFAYTETVRIANKLADLFMRDNPRFDRQRFLHACGLES